MRIYKLDGSFTENKEDIEFGWNCDDIKTNEKGSQDEKISKGHNSQFQSPKETLFMESVDVVETQKPVNVQHINVNVKTEPIVNVVNCKMVVEGFPFKTNEPRLVKEFKTINFSLPPTENVAKLINPCNLETKALLSVIYFAKYKSLVKQDVSMDLFETVNFKTTNFKCLLKDNTTNIRDEIIKDIKHYNATKEDNMLSLMMELILADIDCNLEDIVDVEEQTANGDNPETIYESSDLGNSIQNSFYSKDSNSFQTNCSDVSERCSILSSIGLSDEDKSLQSICEETMQMRLQTAEIKESFREEENRVNQLIKVATALKEEVRETLYLEDILNLLKGDLEKVKLKKLPFKIFYKNVENETELNFII